MPPTIHLEWGVSTHVGHAREENEDSFVAAPPVFAVADGMGGHDRGEVASRLVAEGLAALSNGATLDADTVADALRAAHSQLRNKVGSSFEREMGTTLAAVVLVSMGDSSQWLLVNVGDSRIYRLANGVLCQLSVDHSAVQELISAGELRPEDARSHPDRHVITRAIGIGETIVADFGLRVPEQGERFLICSDGVHGQLSEEEIRVVLISAANPQEAATALAEAVLTGRAADNLTAVVVDVVSDGPEDGGVEPEEDTGPLPLDAHPAQAETFPTDAASENGEDEDQPAVVTSPAAANGNDASPAGPIAEVPGQIGPPPKDPDASTTDHVGATNVGPPDVIEMPEW